MNIDIKQPLVTVFIPSYNHDSYISFCIESIIEQDYEHIELIIIDDGSLDSSVQIINSYHDSCAKRFSNFTFISQENCGLAASANKALALAQGDYFCLIASDDAYLPDKVSRQVNYLEKNKDCAAVFGRCYLLDDKGVVTGETKADNKIYTFREIILMEHRLKAPSAMIRKSVLESVGGYNEEVHIEDWYIWLKITENGKFNLASQAEFVAYYRRHDNNTSRNYRLMFRSAEKILNEYKDLDIYELAYSRLLTVICYEASYQEYIFPFILWKKNKKLNKKESTIQLLRIMLPKKFLSKLRALKHSRKHIL